MVRRTIDEKGERRRKRLDCGAQMETRKGDISYVPRMVIVKKLNSVEGGSTQLDGLLAVDTEQAGARER